MPYDEIYYQRIDEEISKQNNESQNISSDHQI